MHTHMSTDRTLSPPSFSLLFHLSTSLGSLHLLFKFLVAFVSCKSHIVIARLKTCILIIQISYISQTEQVNHIAKITQEIINFLSVISERTTDSLTLPEILPWRTLLLDGWVVHGIWVQSIHSPACLLDLRSLSLRLPPVSC